MANTNTKRIVEDGPRNFVVELIGTLDTSAATFTVAPAIDISVDCVNNDPLYTMNGLKLAKVQYSISDSLALQLFWNATADELMIALAGRGKIDFRDYSPIAPDRTAAGYNGDVDLLVNNVVVAAGTPIQIYTLVLHFNKLYTNP